MNIVSVSLEGTLETGLVGFMFSPDLASKSELSVQRNIKVQSWLQTVSGCASVIN